MLGRIAVPRKTPVARARLSLPMTLLAGLAGSPAWAATAAPAAGEIQRITLDDPSDHFSGGTIEVGGQVIRLPRNLLLDLPANRVTLRQLYLEAPTACLALGETGLAKADACNASGVGGIATIAANRTDGGNVIAGDVLIEKGLEAVTGTVTFIDFNDGWFRLNGTPGDPATGVMVRLNDPAGRHTVQQGLGCAGGPNCSADPRFALDADNYTSVFTTGYPLCLPSTQARTFADVLGLGTTTAKALADGSGDVLCPQANRPATGPVADSRRFAPIRLGDRVKAEGNFEKVNGIRFLSSHATTVLAALVTSTAPSQPDYLFLEEAFVDVAGFQNQRARSLFIGFTTLAPADVLLWSIHYDTANVPHELLLGSTRGCDASAGAGTCTTQGLATGAGDIFRIRHDVDFLVGVKKPELNPCAALRADTRFAALNLCPNGGASGSNIAEMFAVLSPTPHEVQARTGKKYASLQAGGTPLVTLDVRGNQATNGQYRFPFGMGLGGLDVPNPLEFNLAAVDAPYSFSGIPWNLDRRLGPGGCDGACPAAPAPLDPVPFEGVDPRSLATAMPTGSIVAGYYTAVSLPRAADRILSFVDPVLGKFNGNATRLAWPPADPPPAPVAAPADLALVCAPPAPANSPPLAGPDAAITTAGVPVTVAVLANDSDPDGNPLTVVSVGPASAGAVVNNGSSVTYTPAAGFTGADAFAYVIADGAGGTATGTVDVTVIPAANTPPVAVADAATAVSGVPATIPVLANDSDADGDPLSIVAITQGTSGRVVNNGVSVTYTPFGSFTGTDAFTYLVADGRGGVAIGAVSVAVSPPLLERLSVTTALYLVGNLEWRVGGTTTVPGAVVTVHLGPDLGGPVLGTATAAATGAWSFRQRPALLPVDATRRVAVESTGGAVRLDLPVTVR